MNEQVTNLFLERSWDPPLAAPDLQVMIGDVTCLDLHRVSWRGSVMSLDGRRLICHFTAPDAESGRIALRQAGADVRDLWPGTVHDAPGISPADIDAANVAVTRRFETPVVFESFQAVEDHVKHCLDMHNVAFRRSWFSASRQRMVCLYQAPDAESVRLAQREARMPVESVWPFRRYRP